MKTSNSKMNLPGGQRRNAMIPKILAGLWLILLGSAVASIFWYAEWKYSLPTPVPVNYTAVATGTMIPLPSAVGAVNGKPVFLHFFNPDCPCSKFNIEHVRELIRRYGDKVQFTIVLVTAKGYTEQQIQDRFDLRVPVIRDSTLTASCGVYSTPQAVIIDGRHRLYYRGNYNRSRYCNNKKTNYAQAALETILQNKFTVTPDPMAVKAYGCSLPGCGPSPLK